MTAKFQEFRIAGTMSIKWRDRSEKIAGPRAVKLKMPELHPI
jgi:hypothetical protein